VLHHAGLCSVQKHSQIQADRDRSELPAWTGKNLKTNMRDYGLSGVISCAIWYTATASVSLGCMAWFTMKEIDLRARRETNGSEVQYA
jgi:hypothetical protein